MTEFAPEELQAWTGGTWSGPQPSGRISAFAYDTRRLQPGDCFVAIPTERRDGHDFLEAARAGGAAAALVSRPVPGVALPQLVVGHTLRALQQIGRKNRERFPGPVIGITGSCGKTSTKDLLQLLLEPGRTLATEGNLNNQIGVPLTLARMDPASHDYAVVEAGINQPDEMRLLADCISPDIGLVTLVGPAHLELLGSLEAIAGEKVQMLHGERVGHRRYFPESCLKYDAFKALESKAVVLRRSVPGGTGSQAPGDRDFLYSETTRPGQPRVLAIHKAGHPPRFFELPQVSPGMVDNAALAIAVATDLGIPEGQIRSALAGWHPSRHRGEILEAGDQWFYSDCYNANPASVIDALAAFEQSFPERLPRLYILGSMNELGDEAPAFHHEVGAAIRLRPIDYAFFIGEHAEAMLQGLKANRPPAGSCQVFKTAEAVKLPLSQFSGAVLLKGSRSYALETLLPETARPASSPPAAAPQPSPC